MKILIVLPSHSELGYTGNKTGFSVEEFAASHYLKLDTGFDITIASPICGQPPVVYKSEESNAQTTATQKFYKDYEAIDKLAHTLKLYDVEAANHDALFYSGRHGPLQDLANGKNPIKLITDFYKTQNPIAFVYHLPAALVNVKAKNGESLIKEKK